MVSVLEPICKVSISNLFQALQTTDNFTQNIIREISRECSHTSVHVSDDLITYLVRLLELDPQCGINSGHTTRLTIEKFVKKTVKRLCDTDSISLRTLKVQLYFYTKFVSRDLLIDSKRRHIRSRADLLEKEIIVADRRKQKDFQYFYKKIIVFIILRSDLGHPLDSNVQKEVYCALETIFPQSELVHFMTQLSHAEKRAQLTELVHLVSGIRLFNRDCQRGGMGIDDLPSNLATEINESYKLFNGNLMRIMESVYTLTSALDNSFNENLDPAEDIHNPIHLPPGVPESYLDHVTDLLIFARQCEWFFRKLLTGLDGVQRNTNNYTAQLRKLLVKLHGVVKFRNAIPTAQVFPLFMEIAEIWFELKDEHYVLKALNEVVWELTILIKDVQFDHPNIIKMTKNKEILTDAQRMEKASGASLPKCTNCAVSDYHQITSVRHISIEYLGFCPYAIVEYSGALIPGNPNLGLFRWNHMNFTVSSPRAAEKFGSTPFKYVSKILQFVTEKPELISFLQLYDHLNTTENIERYVDSSTKVPTRTARVQTELHPQEVNIDSNYSWNVWDLKRNALQLSNTVSTHKTKAQQNGLSHFHASVATQTYPPKDQVVQTMKDNYTSVPRRHYYIFGLRGRRDDKQEVIQL